MRNLSQPTVIGLELFGGLLIVMAVWVDELVSFHHFLLAPFNLPKEFEELVVETFLALIGLVVMLAATTVLYSRIRKLESFIVMCAWCRKIKLDNEWISVEDYLARQNKQETSHGICPICAEEQIRRFEERSRK